MRQNALYMISFPQDGPGLLAQRPPGGVVRLVEHCIKRPFSHQLPPTGFAGQQCSQKLRRQGDVRCGVQQCTGFVQPEADLPQRAAQS